MQTKSFMSLVSTGYTVTQRAQKKRSYKKRLQFQLVAKQNQKPCVVWDGKGGMLRD